MKNLIIYSIAFLLFSLPSFAQDGNETHFTVAFEGNGQDHMNINILEAKIEDVSLEAGDEIAVFDGDICCGLYVLEGTIDINNPSTFGLIAASKADDNVANGFTAGNSITIKFWNAANQKEYTVSTIEFIDPQTGAVITAEPFTPNSSVFVKAFAFNKVFIYDEIVECDSYTWRDGNTYDENVDSLAFKYNQESDTTYILKLTIHQSETVNISKAICAGQSVTIGDEEFTETGIHEVTLANQFGCDSVVSLDLTVNPTFGIDKTTIFNVADPEFEDIGTRTLLVETINLLSEYDCDSVIYNYETYNFVPNYYTDTTFISVADTLIIDIDTGIDGLPLPEAIQLKMYPNPANSELHIQISNWEILSGFSVNIYNTEGQEIESVSVDNSELIINVSNFEEGAYIVNIHKNGDILVNKKLIIK